MKKYKEMIYPLIKELCKIPAPSYFEDERAEFCKKYLIDAGYDKVWIDEAKNVLCEINCDNSDEITVFCAHTDTVFPDREPMPFYEKDGKAYCPGIGDDTASLATLLVSAKYMKDNEIVPSKGMLFVCNACEEGLGNLKGTRAVMEKYKGRVSRFLSIDAGKLNNLTVNCVGSHRYLVEVQTEGGHSFGRFGNENAINHLSKMVTEIYKIEVPKKEGSKTTYNVGTIEGGTSVNTIAQSAKMLCEYRSDDVQSLSYMQNKFEEIFKNARNSKVIVNVTKVGDRPCANGLDEKELNNFIDTCSEVIKKHTGEVNYSIGSTDCNIPMSMGIPAVAFGSYNGNGCHTREEYIEIDSLDKGFEIAIDMIKAFV